MSEGVSGKNTEPTGSATGSRAGRWYALIILACIAIIISHALLWLRIAELREHSSKERMFWTLCQPGSSKPQRGAAFAELLWLGNREWRSARLDGLDLSGTQMAKASIQSANMRGCKLVGADLSDAILRQTRLDQADLTDADLSRADLFEAHLLKAELAGANFSNADLRGADLSQSHGPGTNFVMADLSAASLEMAVLSTADLRLARLAEADLRLANLTAANLFRTELHNARLDRADLTNANWWRAIGLTPAQIDLFRDLYPPADDAQDSLKQDFEAWLGEQASALDSAANPATATP